jgi:hypothetical protein
MKSTGLFGKNSGRVGGVVYSNYRGEQVVRSYQPQVKNPNTKLQIAQRAKFKLVSQLGASFGKELKNSFVPNNKKLTSRNAWVKEMLKKTIYTSGKASLPIEEIIMTNATGGINSANVSGNRITISLPASNWDIERVKARILIIGYSEGGEVVLLSVTSLAPLAEQPTTEFVTFGEPLPIIPEGFSNIRAIVYAYEQKREVGVNYEDYEVQGDEATLSDIVRAVGLSNLHFSESLNISVPQNV